MPAKVVNMVLSVQMRSGDHERRGEGEQEGQMVR